MGKMRVTQHNGRIRKSGQAYSPKHNDRSFDLDKADNIDASRVGLNLYWSIASGEWYDTDEQGSKPTFEDVERDFYEAHFMPMYEASKARSAKRGQSKRVKPFEEWRQARQHVPEETFLQIGSVDDGTVSEKTFITCAIEYMNAMQEWADQHGKPFTVLDAAFHFDERIPQLHVRRVWHSVDPSSGLEEIGQNKALERAGVALPDPSAPVGAKNNRKMTFDAYMRERWLEICEAHGLDIERVPAQGQEHNRTREKYIEQKQKERTAALDSREAALDRRAAELAGAEAARDAALDKVQEATKLLNLTETAIQEQRREKAALEKAIGNMKKYMEWEEQEAQKQAQTTASTPQRDDKTVQTVQVSKPVVKASERPVEAAKAAEAIPDAGELFRRAQAKMRGGGVSVTDTVRRSPSPTDAIQRQFRQTRNEDSRGRQDTQTKGPSGPSL